MRCKKALDRTLDGRTWPRQAGAVLVAVAFFAQACTSPTDLPPSATALTPPAIYADWWAMTQACSGRTGDFTRLHWYRVPGAVVTVNNADYAGYYEQSANRIVLTDDIVMYGAGVRHEMLHALLNVPGHPRDEFLGACRDVVNCELTCITDAGPWTPPAAFVPLAADSLTITSSVELRPRESDGQRWVVLHVNATNPLPRAVYAVSGGGPTSWAISVADHFVDELPHEDTSAFFFAANESRSWTYEMRVSDEAAAYSLPAGSYLIAGAFGQHWTPYLPVVLVP